MLAHLDVASDIYVICQYHASGQLKAAQLSLGFLGLKALNAAVQIAICVSDTVGQNYRNPKALAGEVPFTLIFAEPLLEVRRIARGEQKQWYQLFKLTPLDESTYQKGLKGGAVFAESGPAAFLQLLALHSIANPSAGLHL